MGQRNSERISFRPRQEITSLVNDDIQLLAFTGYYKVGDAVDVVDVDANGNILSTLADNLTVLNINPDVSVVLSAAVDTSAAVGTPMLVAQEIDDVQEAIDRLYRRKFSGAVQFTEVEAILGRKLDTPNVGEGTYFVEDVSFYRVGDIVDIIADEGGVATGAEVLAVSPNADDTNNKASIVIDQTPDTDTFTNPKFVNTSLTVEQAIRRNQERIDELDRPVENEYMGVGEGTHGAYEATNLFRAGTSKLLLDGSRKRLGTAGTRASHTQGTYPGTNTSLKFSSMLLGLLGNEVEVRVQAGAGFTIAVTKAFKSNATQIISGQTQYLIVINNNGGAATTKQIADALNAHAEVKRIVQVQYGGDGAGLAPTFGPTALAGGLDNGTGDYAELEQIYENSIVNTGYKWISYHIRPNEKNRMSSPPLDDEENCIDYRRPSENVNR